jgi:hypothetical protein
MKQIFIPLFTSLLFIVSLFLVVGVAGAVDHGTPLIKVAPWFTLGMITFLITAVISNKYFIDGEWVV